MALMETEIHSDYTVIRVRKKLDATLTGEFTALWKDTVNSGVTRVLLDLSGLDYLDSSGIGAIVTLRNAVHSKNGRLVVLNGPNNICRVFEITGMRSKIESHDTAEAAIKSILSDLTT